MYSKYEYTQKTEYNCSQLSLTGAKPALDPVDVQISTSISKNLPQSSLLSSAVPRKAPEVEQPNSTTDLDTDDLNSPISTTIEGDLGVGDVDKHAREAAHRAQKALIDAVRAQQKTSTDHMASVKELVQSLFQLQPITNKGTKLETSASTHGPTRSNDQNQTAKFSAKTDSMAAIDLDSAPDDSQRKLTEILKNMFDGYGTRLSDTTDGVKPAYDDLQKTFESHYKQLENPEEHKDVDRGHLLKVVKQLPPELIELVKRYLVQSGSKDNGDVVDTIQNLSPSLLNQIFSPLIMQLLYMHAMIAPDFNNYVNKSSEDAPVQFVIDMRQVTDDIGIDDPAATAALRQADTDLDRLAGRPATNNTQQGQLQDFVDAVITTIGSYTDELPNSIGTTPLLPASSSESGEMSDSGSSFIPPEPPAEPTSEAEVADHESSTRAAENASSEGRNPELVLSIVPAQLNTGDEEGPWTILPLHLPDEAVGDSSNEDVLISGLTLLDFPPGPDFTAPENELAKAEIRRGEQELDKETDRIQVDKQAPEQTTGSAALADMGELEQEAKQHHSQLQVVPSLLKSPSAVQATPSSEQLSSGLLNDLLRTTKTPRTKAATNANDLGSGGPISASRDSLKPSALEQEQAQDSEQSRGDDNVRLQSSTDHADSKDSKPRLTTNLEHLSKLVLNMSPRTKALFSQYLVDSSLIEKQTTDSRAIIAALNNIDPTDYSDVFPPAILQALYLDAFTNHSPKIETEPAELSTKTLDSGTTGHDGESAAQPLSQPAPANTQSLPLTIPLHPLPIQDGVPDDSDRTTDQDPQQQQQPAHITPILPTGTALSDSSADETHKANTEQKPTKEVTNPHGKSVTVPLKQVPLQDTTSEPETFNGIKIVSVPNELAKVLAQAQQKPDTLVGSGAAISSSESTKPSFKQSNVETASATTPDHGTGSNDTPGPKSTASESAGQKLFHPIELLFTLTPTYNPEHMLGKEALKDTNTNEALKFINPLNPTIDLEDFLAEHLQSVTANKVHSRSSSKPSAKKDAKAAARAILQTTTDRETLQSTSAPPTKGDMKASMKAKRREEREAQR